MGYCKSCGKTRKKKTRKHTEKLKKELIEIEGLCLNGLISKLFEHGIKDKRWFKQNQNESESQFMTRIINKLKVTIKSKL